MKRVAGQACQRVVCAAIPHSVVETAQCVARNGLDVTVGQGIQVVLNRRLRGGGGQQCRLVGRVVAPGEHRGHDDSRDDGQTHQHRGDGAAAPPLRIRQRRGQGSRIRRGRIRRTWIRRARIRRARIRRARIGRCGGQRAGRFGVGQRLAGVGIGTLVRLIRAGHWSSPGVCVHGGRVTGGGRWSAGSARQVSAHWRQSARPVGLGIVS